MKRLSVKQIHQAFNERTRQNLEADFSQPVKNAIKNLSLALRDMQEAGINVRAEIFASVSEHAFNMPADEHCSLCFSGILHIGGAQHLFALQDTVGEAPEIMSCLRLFVSCDDIRFHGARKDVPADMYDLEEDPKAMIEFQTSIINLDAQHKIIMSCDEGETFNRDNKVKVLHKPFG